MNAEQPAGFDRVGSLEIKKAGPFGPAFLPGAFRVTLSMPPARGQLFQGKNVLEHFHFEDVCETILPVDL